MTDRKTLDEVALDALVEKLVAPGPLPSFTKGELETLGLLSAGPSVAPANTSRGSAVAPKNDDCWVTKDGRRLAWEDMETWHVERAIKRLHAEGKTDWWKYRRLLDEAERRGLEVDPAASVAHVRPEPILDGPRERFNPETGKIEPLPTEAETFAEQLRQEVQKRYGG